MLSLDRPLRHVKVADFSRMLPGPFCSLLLADLGAEVIKVEEPGVGDYTRWVPPMGPSTSGAFAALNREKRSIAVNLKVPSGQAVARRLASRADVVLEGFRPGVMDRLGLGYEALRRENPRLIYCAISGFGQHGPHRDRAGHDIGYASLAGVAAMHGPRGETPAVPAVQTGDYSGGLYATVAIVAALVQRERSGEGCFLDVSMTEGALSFLTLLAGKLAAGFENATRGEDELVGGLPCYGVYATRDGKAVSIGALEPKFWQRFCEVVDRPDLLDQGHLVGAKGDPAREELRRIFASRTRDEWVAAFEGVDACVEPVLEPNEVAEHPVHLERRAFATVGDLRLALTPFADRDKVHEPAPPLGRDTAQVLSELGYTDEEITALRREGVISQS